MANEKLNTGELLVEFFWNAVVSTLLGFEFKSAGLGLVSLTILATLDRIARRVRAGA